MLLLCLRTKTYMSPQLLVYLPIYVPIHDPTCSFSSCPQTYLFINIPVRFISYFSVYPTQWPFNSSTGVPTHRSTRKYIYLFTFMLLFRLTIKTYLSPQLLVYLPIFVPVHGPTCSFWYFHSDQPFRSTRQRFLLFYTSTDVPVHHYTVLHVHSCTCSSLYLFSLFLLLRHNMHNDLSTHLWVPTRRSTRFFFNLFTLTLLLCLRTQNYLSPQLLVYLPIYVPVHDPTCSFSDFHSD